MRVERKPASRDVIKNWMPGSGAEDFVMSANIRATKPAGSAANRTAAANDAPLVLDSSGFKAPPPPEPAAPGEEEDEACVT